MAFLVAMTNKFKTKVLPLLDNDNHLSEQLSVTTLQTTQFYGVPSLVKADFDLSHHTFLVSRKLKLKTIQ